MRTEDVIGLIPCGGHATRISPLPCSKEVFPVGFRRMNDGSLRPKVVSHYLLEQMRQGGVRKAFLILRSGKWDIAQYHGNGASIGMDLGYLMMGKPYGAAYTLDAACPFLRGARVALGFPDILFEPPDAYARVLHRLTTTRADLVLGLCRVRDTSISDMLAIGRDGVVRELVIKPKATKLKLGWIIAAWTSVFTEFMHEYLLEPRTAAELPDAGLPAELTVGHVIQAAVARGLPTQSVVFPRATYLDIGTPENLIEAVTASTPPTRR
jgi:glucose-1-phosphate thymidylyltransferase